MSVFVQSFDSRTSMKSNVPFEFVQGLNVENAICRNLSRLYQVNDIVNVENVICRNLSRLYTNDFIFENSVCRNLYPEFIQSSNEMNSIREHETHTDEIISDQNYVDYFEHTDFSSDDDDSDYFEHTDFSSDDDDSVDDNGSVDDNASIQSSNSNYDLTVLNGTGEITKSINIVECIGIAVFGRWNFKLGNYYSNNNDFENMIKYYNDAIELVNVDSMINLAIHYETKCKNIKKAEELYLLAIELDDSDAMYNLADMYLRTREHEKMIKYFDMAIKHGDKESIICLFNHYQQLLFNSTDPSEHDQLEKNMAKYYSLAVNTIPNLHGDKNTSRLFKGLNNLDVFQRRLLLDMIGTPHNEIAAENYRLLSLEKDLIVYDNKVRLFQSLNHVCDCAICFEKKLHIDIHCGHTFCTDCYPNIYKKNCPLCRIAPI